MLTGLPPFYTPNREELFERIKFGTLKYPPHLTADAKSLLDGLFKKDPSKRLGGGEEGARALKAHPWFSRVDWDAVLRKEVKPPFIPVLKSEIDVSNFDHVREIKVFLVLII
jgi:serine/threonine protein kinase